MNVRHTTRLILLGLPCLVCAPGCGGGGATDSDGSQFSGTSETGDGDGDGSESNTNGDGDGDPGDGDGDPTGDGDGDGDPTGDGDGDPSGDGDGDDACQQLDSDIAPVPPNVAFLLDRSGSMTEVGFDLMDPDKSRWQSLYEAVEGVVGGGNDQDIAFGAKTFSTEGFGACGVSDTMDVPIAVSNAAALLAGIPGPMSIVSGGTPTPLALEKMMDYMIPLDVDGSKVVILITDGRFSCDVDTPEDEDAALVAAVTSIEAGLSADVITYVVGIAPSMFGPIMPQLDAMADAGGAANPIPPHSYYQADDAAALSAALLDLVADSYQLSCLLNFAEAPFFPDYTKVVIGGNEYELVEDCDAENGFVYTDDTFTQIEMCGTGCEDLAEFKMAHVQFYCNPN